MAGGLRNRWPLVAAVLLAAAAAGAIQRLDFELDRELEQADSDFADRLRKLFYSKRGASEPVRALSARMADIELAMHAVERRTLLAAKRALRRHLAEARRGPVALAPNRDLVDVLLQRCLMRAIADGLAGTERRLGELYVLMQRHRGAAGVTELAREFFEAHEGWKDLTNIAEYELEAALAAYAPNGTDPRLLGARDGAPPETAVLEAVDGLIDAAMGCSRCAELNEPMPAMKGMHSMFADRPADLAALVDSHVDPQVLGDVRRARAETAASLGPLDAAEVDAVDPDDVLEFEEELFGYRNASE